MKKIPRYLDGLASSCHGNKCENNELQHDDDDDDDDDDDV